MAEAAARYKRVMMLGDSMGATGALMLAPLATSVHCFCPQARILRPDLCMCEGYMSCYLVCVEGDAAFEIWYNTLNLI